MRGLFLYPFSIFPMIQAATAGCFFHTPGKAQTGLDRDGFRSQVEGFGRSEASSTTWENKKQQAIIDRFTKKMESNGYHVSGFSDYVGDARTLEEMQSAFEKISQLYPDESKGLTIALTYTDDPDTLGWFDPKTGRIHFSREQFKNWETAQEEYNKLVEAGIFPRERISEDAFITNSVILSVINTGGKAIEKR